MTANLRFGASATVRPCRSFVGTAAAQTPLSRAAAHHQTITADGGARRGSRR